MTKKSKSPKAASPKKGAKKGGKVAKAPVDKMPAKKGAKISKGKKGGKKFNASAYENKRKKVFGLA